MRIAIKGKGLVIPGSSAFIVRINLFGIIIKAVSDFFLADWALILISVIDDGYGACNDIEGRMI